MEPLGRLFHENLYVFKTKVLCKFVLELVKVLWFCFFKFVNLFNFVHKIDDLVL